MFIALQPTPEKPKKQPATLPPFPLWNTPAVAEWQLDEEPTEFKLRLCQLDEQSQPAREITLTQADWQALPRQTVKRGITSPHWWTYTGQWRGVSLSDLWAALRKNHPDLPLSPDTYLIQRNVLGQTQPLRLTETLIANSLVADELNGQPIPANWGGPLWLVVFDRAHTLGLEHLTEVWFGNQPPRLPSRYDNLDWPVNGVLDNGQYLDCNTAKWVPLSHSPS